MKRTLILIICLLAAIPSDAQERNRYGMKFMRTGDKYVVEKVDQIEKIVDLTRVPDLYVPYRYVADKIKSDDYKKCVTRKYVFKDYGDRQLELEVDLPVSGKGPYPFVIYVHGGGWISGGLNGFANQSTYMASNGIAGVRVTYTLVKDGGHFEMGIKEIDEAYAFIAGHADEWGLDMSRFGFAGGSAGTPLSSYWAMRKENCKLFIGFNGIYDFTSALPAGNFPGNNQYLRYIDTPEKRKAISPIHAVPRKNPPAVLVAHGTADVTIRHHQSIALCDTVEANGGKACKLIYPYYVHSFFNRNVSDKYEEVTLAKLKFAEEIFGIE